jgi:general secretion pathway protein E/type IV pilus assembly protein PilB
MQDKKLLDDTSASRARSLIAEGKTLEQALVSADGLSEEAVLRFLAEAFDIPYIENEYLEKTPPAKDFLTKFPVRLLLRYGLLPLEDRDGYTVVATSKISDHGAIDELRVASGRDLLPALAPASEIERALKKILGVGADTLQSLDQKDEGLQVLDTDKDDDLDLAHAAQDASIIKFVNQILTEAIEMRATDVHIEPFEDQLRLRYRIDGVLVQANVPPSVRRFHAAIVSRLKILSHLDIAEKRLPQDGRIKLRINAREIDIRVSIIPMIHGEAVVLRILDRTDAVLGTEHIGMAERDRKEFDKILDMPHGIVLVTGPTGSGKTTTLYAALSKINDTERKIITIEDPVEYQLKGVNQIQVSEKAGLTFARGLRSILRHDPDVILIGEIRDQETAQIAVQASLTGHLVFSTLHTNDAPGAVTRLVDMGVEPYLVASSLESVLAQRLVRVLCKHCKQEDHSPTAQAFKAQIGIPASVTIYRSVGCRECRNTGFLGRHAIFEWMDADNEIRQLILKSGSTDLVRDAARRGGMRTLAEDGWRLVRLGITTVEEVLSVTTAKEVASTTKNDSQDGTPENVSPATLAVARD